MSFILDALRKSENERREQGTPTLAATPQAQPSRKKNIWLPIIAVILTLNIIVVATLLLTRDEPTAAVPAMPAPLSPPAIVTPPSVSTAPAAQPVPAPAPAPAAPNVPAPPPVNANPVIPEPTPQPTRSEPVEKIAPVVQSAPPRAVARTSSIQEAIPSFAELKANGRITSANLRIDMHVYSADPSKRMVFINMSKYREGQRITEGPKLLEITPEGAILSEQGNRFRLNRD